MYYLVFSIRKICLFSLIYLFVCLFIQSSTVLYQYGLVLIYFILSVIIQCYVICSLLKCFHLWPLEACSDWLLCPFTCPILLLLEHFLSFWYYKIFQPQLILSLPQPQYQPCPQGAPVASMGKWYLETKIWVRVYLLLLGMSLLLGTLSAQFQEIYLCILHHVYTHNLSIYLSTFYLSSTY